MTVCVTDVSHLSAVSVSDSVMGVANVANGHISSTFCICREQVVLYIVSCHIGMLDVTGDLRAHTIPQHLQYSV